DFTIADRQQGGADVLGNIFVGHHPRHADGGGDEQQNDGGRADRIHQDPGQVSGGDLPVIEPQNQGIDHGNGRGFGSGENAGDDPPDHNNKQKQAGNGIDKGTEDLREAASLADGKLLALGPHGGNAHQQQPDNNAGHIACYKKGGNRDAPACQRID